MTKWADYLISEVRYVETTTTKHISQVKVHIDKGEKVETPSVWSRDDVMNAINNNSTFMTITRNSEGKWSRGALLEKVWEYNAWYIKTKKDKTTKDNLGSLPEF